VNRRLLVPLSVVLVGVVYAFLAQFTLASVVAYALGAAVVYAAWRLDEEHPASGWARLAAVVLGMLILLSGKGWRGSVPWQTLVFTGTTILTFALFSLGLNLEFGFGGLINFGHVAFMALGAYTVALLAVRGGFWATQPGILVAFLLALAVAAVAGLLLALPAIRLREDYLAIVTIAAAEILRRVLRNEQDLTRGARGVPLSGSLRPLHLQALADVPLVGPWIVGGLERLSLAAELTGSAYLFVLAGIVLALSTARGAASSRRSARTRTRSARWASTRPGTSCRSSRSAARSRPPPAPCGCGSWPTWSPSTSSRSAPSGRGS